MFYIKKNQLKKLIFEYFFITLIFIFFLNFLIPHGYEPSGESFNEWAAAKMLFDGDGFPIPSMPVLYTIYSGTLIHFFSYPSFIVFEYHIAYLFFFISMYICIKTRINKFLSTLVCIAFIPSIIVVEGHNTIIGCGILFIYIRNVLLEKKSHFISTTLLLSTMFHQAFLPFFIGHSLGFIIKNKSKISLYKIMLFLKSGFIKKIDIKFTTLIIITAIYLVAFNFQSVRKDNNYFMSENTWAPVKLDTPTEIGVFQIAPHFYSVRHFSKETVLNQDWYFSSPQILNGAKNLYEVFYKAPLIILDNAITNTINLVYLPNTLLFQWPVKPVILISLIIFIFVVIKSFLWLLGNKMYSPLTSLSLGIISTLAVLIITWTHNFRYNVIYFPIFLPFLFHVFSNMSAKPTLNRITLSTISILILAGSISFSINKKQKYNGFNFNFFNVEGGLSNNFDRMEKLLKTNDVILSSSSNALWLKSFFKINSKQVIDIMELAPFKESKLSNLILNKSTLIWINDDMLYPTISVGQNSHLRYNYHILPFLKSNNYNIIDFGKSGKVYRIIK